MIYKCFFSGWLQAEPVATLETEKAEFCNLEDHWLSYLKDSPQSCESPPI